MGVMLEAGENEVIFQYHTPSMEYFGAVSIAATAVLIWLFIREPRKKEGMS